MKGGYLGNSWLIFALKRSLVSGRGPWKCWYIKMRSKSILWPTICFLEFTSISNTFLNPMFCFWFIISTYINTTYAQHTCKSWSNLSLDPFFSATDICEISIKTNKNKIKLRMNDTRMCFPPPTSIVSMTKFGYLFVVKYHLIIKRITFWVTLDKPISSEKHWIWAERYSSQFFLRESNSPALPC